MRAETNCRKRGLTCRKAVRKIAGRRSSFANFMTNDADVVGGEPSAITKLQAPVLAGVSRHVDSNDALLLVSEVLILHVATAVIVTLRWAEQGLVRRPLLSFPQTSNP